MRRILFSLLSIFLLGSLFACSLVRPGSQAPTPTFVNGEITENENPGEAEIYVLVPTATSTSAPNCFDTPVQIRVMENAPRMGIQSLTPEFQWYLGTGGLTMNSLDDWDTMCVPDHYTLYLTSGPDFDDEIVVNVTGYSVVADMTKLTME